MFAGRELIVGIYVDDLLITGSKIKVEKFVSAIGKAYEITYNMVVAKFLGMNFEHRDKNTIVLRQTSAIDKMTYKFASEIMNLQNYQTPDAQGFITHTPLSTDEILPQLKQEKYRSGVGTLLYLTKMTRPDICNIARELSKVMRSATNGDYKALLSVIKYLEITKLAGLVLSPSRSRDGQDELLAYVDSDWAGDTYTRKSVSGWILYLNGSVLTWGSRGQRTVTLSSSTAEYVALTETVKEVLFANMIATEILFDIIKPITVYCDNMGAIFLSKNCEGKRTKYLDVKYHFIREYVAENIISVKFIPSEKNKADPFTKNVNITQFLNGIDYLA